MIEKQIVIIGAGPAGLMAAHQLALKGAKVHVYEQNKAAARKFLVAGKGGFNLTHNQELSSFNQNYDADLVKEAVQEFDNQKVVAWLCDLGVSTYVGSSGKIFPTKNFKPIHVLNAWLEALKRLGVEIHYDSVFTDFDDSKVYLKKNEDLISVPYSTLVLALGGGSWKKTGSDSKWVETLKAKHIAITPLESANSGYTTLSTYHHLQGQYLKNIKLSFESHSKVGELVFTKYGIEGSPVYAMNRFTRKQPFPLVLEIDLKPSLSQEEILEQLKGATKISPVLKRGLKLSTTAINLLKTLDKESYLDIDTLSKSIKRFTIEVLSLRPIDEVISTSGGVAFQALSDNLELKGFANVYCAGEMVDWEAPTGGYLLQGCFSTGYRVAQAILES